MIKNDDRAGYFGASDTAKVISKSRKSKTWQDWWLVKLGAKESDFTGNIYTEAGNKYEHPILRSISPEVNFDRQIIIEKLKLRVNYDGDLDGTIYEVKTHQAVKDFEITKAIYGQCQVQMYAWKQANLRGMKDSEGNDIPKLKKLYVVSYPLMIDEYNKGWDEVEVDANRVKFTEVKYDKGFIKGEYLPSLKELARALKKGKVVR